jgi:hypothetical protein
MGSELTTNKFRSLENWTYNPLYAETINVNPFRIAVTRALEGHLDPDPLSPYAATDEPLENKIARLLPADLIVPDGDVIYIIDADTGFPIPLMEALDILRGYLHMTMKDTEKAAAILEQNFMGRNPVRSGIILRDAVGLIRQPSQQSTEEQDDILETVSMTARRETQGQGIPEFGTHHVNYQNVEVIAKAFGIWNKAIGEPGFFQKLALYPFNMPFREKAFIINGTGGDGKGIFTNLLKRLYGHMALTGAPVPSFVGHDRFTATRSFIGKRFVVFNDVENPSVQFMEWLKPMTTGSMQVKEINTSSLVSMPCKAVFMLETNFQPEFLATQANYRRFIFRNFPPAFDLTREMTESELDIIGERGPVTAGDMAFYLMQVHGSKKQLNTFPDKELPLPAYYDFITKAPAALTTTEFNAYCKAEGLTTIEKRGLKQYAEQRGKL